VPGHRSAPVPGRSNLRPDATPGIPQQTSASEPTPVGPVPFSFIIHNSSFIIFSLPPSSPQPYLYSMNCGANPTTGRRRPPPANRRARHPVGMARCAVPVAERQRQATERTAPTDVDRLNGAGDHPGAGQCFRFPAFPLSPFPHPHPGFTVPQNYPPAHDPWINRPLEPMYNCEPAGDSPSPGGEGRGEGGRILILRGPASIPVQAFNARIAHSGNPLHLSEWRRAPGSGGAFIQFPPTLDLEPGTLDFSSLPKPNGLASLSPGSLPRSHPGYTVPQNNPPLRHSEWRRGAGERRHFPPILAFSLQPSAVSRAPAPSREATPDISQPRCGWNQPNKVNPSCRDAGKETTAGSPAQIVPAIGFAIHSLPKAQSPEPKACFLTLPFSPTPCREATPDISQPRCGWNQPNHQLPPFRRTESNNMRLCGNRLQK